MENCYQIKLRQLGYRLVYQINIQHQTLEVIVVGKRNRNFVYQEAKNRI